MKKQIIVLCFILVVFCVSKSFAAPNISSVSGTVQHKGTITITGSDFGTKSPAAPLWWDDMEGHPDSSTTFTTGDLPGVISSMATGWKHYAGAANTSGSYEPALIHFRSTGYTPPSTSYAVDGPHQYSNIYATGAHWQFSGDDPCYDCQSEQGYDNVGLSVCDNAGGHNIWYAHWYYRLTPEWSKIPWGYTTSEYLKMNHKFINMESGYGQYTSPFCYFAYGGPCGAYSGYPASESGDHVGIQSANCLNQTGKHECGIDGTGEANPKIGWVYYEMFWDSDNDDVSVWANNRKNLYYDQGTQTLPDNKQGITFGAWMALYPVTPPPPNEDFRGSQKNWRFYDDIYVDTTYSRVMLGNNSTYSSCTVIDPQIPSTWARSSITVTVNQGALTDGTAYLFVFDADNNHNPLGYPVTIGGGGGGGDSAAPYTSGHFPEKGAVGFYKDSNIVVHLQDSGDGVDQSSIVMTVNGQTVSPTITGSASDYTLTYDPPNPLEGDVVVRINAQDLANPPNVMPQETYTFTVNRFTFVE
jgi:hypothetical protein